MKSNRQEFIKGAAGAGLAAGALGALSSESIASEDVRKERKLDLTYVTYCGLYCKLCSAIARIPRQSSALHETLVDAAYEYWGDREFLKKLKGLSESDKNFTGCRGGKCGDPGCEIRKCAQERKVEVCSSCPEYPCKHIEGLAKRYPTLLSDGKRQKEIGLEKWIEEQEERAKTCFCYADIRYPDTSD